MSGGPVSSFVDAVLHIDEVSPVARPMPRLPLPLGAPRAITVS